jgi:hypothetical protein
MKRVERANQKTGGMIPTTVGLNGEPGGEHNRPVVERHVWWNFTILRRSELPRDRPLSNNISMMPGRAVRQRSVAAHRRSDPIAIGVLRAINTGSDSTTQRKYEESARQLLADSDVLAVSAWMYKQLQRQTSVLSLHRNSLFLDRLTRDLPSWSMFVGTLSALPHRP